MSRRNTPFTANFGVPRSVAARSVRAVHRPVAFAVFVLLSPVAHAQPAPTQLPTISPQGARINASVGPISGTAANPVMAISQSASLTNRAVIEWNNFSIGSDARVNITQPNSQSLLLNRVVSDQSSQIYGSLSANGRVFIVNPFGVLFGGTAQVSVGGLVASSLDLNPAMTANNYAGFLNAKAIEMSGAGQSGVEVLPSGLPLNKIQTVNGGSVILLGGGQVVHGGLIDAPGGRIQLATATTAQLVPVGASGFVDLVVTQPRAIGGVVISESGVLSASSSIPGTHGGEVILQGPTVAIRSGDSHAQISADGPAGGGSITVGDSNTRAVALDPGTTLSADATDRGDGGSIAVRANFNSIPISGNPQPRVDFGVAEVYGNLYARGGPNGGNGGNVETSGVALTTSLGFPIVVGNGTTVVTQAASIDASARAIGGVAGRWTLDPFDVVISNAASVAVNGVFNPTGPGANVRALDISTALNGGTSVEISTGTTTTGNAAGDITLAGATTIDRTAGTGATALTLRAHGNVSLAAGSGITSKGAGPLNVSLFSDLDGNGNGSVSMVGAAITTAGGNVTLSGGVDPSTGFAGASAQSPGVLVQRSDISTIGGTTRGNVVIRGSSVGATASAASQSGVVLTGASTIEGGNIAIIGQAGAGTAVRIDGTSMATDTGSIQIRGVATRNLAATGRAIGVDLAGGTFVELGAGSLTVAGRGDENGLAANAPAIGVRMDDLRVNAATASTGSIMVAGQSLGSAGPGIAYEGSLTRGLDVVNDNDGFISPIGANAAIGASAAQQAPKALGLDTNTLRILTNGAVNVRPLGVDVAGNVVELPTVPIVVGAASSAPAGSLAVNPTLLNAPGVQTGGLSATQGIVIGSSVHTGLVTLDPNALPNQTSLSLNLQNDGVGSAGMQIGGGNVLGSLALLSSGNINQSGPINAQSLLIRGGAASRVDLSNAGNQMHRLAFDPPQFLSVATQGNLTVDAASGLGYDASSNAFTPLTITNSAAGAQTLLRSIAGDVLLNRSITLTGTGSPSLDLVTSKRFVSAPGAAITSPPGGQWRVWSQAPANVTRGDLQASNLYGCVFGDSATCSVSGVALPNGNRFLFADQPILTVNANGQSSPAGSPVPPLTYSATGFANGDAAVAALGGSLATVATASSPPGTYPITQGTLASPLGYRINYLGANLVLELSLIPPGFPPETVGPNALAGFHSDVYGSNRSLPYICTAASTLRDTEVESRKPDPLASEWGKVRDRPQLSGCLDVVEGGQCDAF